jgi:hypothetical protein
MKFKLLFLLFILPVAFQAQNTSYDNDIKYFIEINGTMGQYRDAINQLMPMLKAQYKDNNVSEKDWEEMKLIADNSLDGLADDLVVIYKKFFTHDEIKQLNKLYKNAVVQKFVNNVVNLSDASQDASIVWSRSLYNTINDLLHQKGYTK